MISENPLRVNFLLALAIASIFIVGIDLGKEIAAELNESSFFVDVLEDSDPVNHISNTPQLTVELPLLGEIKHAPTLLAGTESFSIFKNKAPPIA